MQKNLWLKLLFIGLISIALLIPLAMIKGKIYERQNYRDQVKVDIANSWTGNQTITFPVLVISYTTESEQKIIGSQGYVARTQTQTEVHQTLLALPDLKVKVQQKSDYRYKGIYQIPIYTADITAHGTISMRELNETKNKLQKIDNFGHFLPLQLAIGIKDPRGLVSAPVLKIAGKAIAFKAGHAATFDDGFNTNLDEVLANSGESSQPIDLHLALRGLEQLDFIPSSRTFAIALQSDWPHPQFTGNYLPTSRDIDSKGYSATWQLNEFSTGIERAIESCRDTVSQCNKLKSLSFGVALFDPIDVYQQTDRATKYAMLFILISFTTFFMFEVIKALCIHPIQYLFVGLALAIFYLLLIALSEHIKFGWSYAVATAACVGLISLYLKSILKQWLIVLPFSAVLLALYAMLFVIMQMEDYALLVGTALTFTLLSTLMLATRNINWYALGRNQSE